MFPRDARHWIGVYREMIVFKKDLLARMNAQLQGLPVAARQDVVDNDVALLEDQLERYNRRLEFWYAKQWDLEGLQIDDEARTITFRERSVTFTKREFQLLTFLATHSPKFVTAAQLLVQAWHDGQLPEETLRTYIGRVRAKLDTLGIAAQIVNQPRRGYALIFKDPPQTHGGGWRPREP